jgi:hypothetical protein
MLSILMWIARLYLWRWLPGGKRARFYSINVMRARHPACFKEDLGRLLGMLASGAIRPRVAERISFDEVAEAHRRLGRAVLRASLFCAGEATVLPRSEMPTLVGSSTTEILPAES